jgi:hypothetical protein
MSRRSQISFGGEFAGSGTIGTRFLYPSLGILTAGPGYQATELFIVVPRALTVVSLAIQSRVQGTIRANPSPPPAELTVTGIYVLRKNGVDTALSVTIVKDDDADPWAGASTGAIAFAAGDRMSMKIVLDQTFDGTPSNISHMLVATF